MEQKIKGTELELPGWLKRSIRRIVNEHKRQLKHLPCRHGGKAARKHKKCQCDHCRAYAKMMLEDGIGRWFFFDKVGPIVLEANDM